MGKTATLVKTKWEFAKAAPKRFLAQFPEHPRPIAQLLYNRDLTTDQAIQDFLSPTYTKDLHDPMQLKGMPEAVTTIRQAIAKEANIVIHGDYDADGITATALLRDVLRRLGGKVTTYLPNRYLDGYGVSAENLKRLRGGGADLVITVDCGISSAEAVAAGRADGLRVVITDHHLPPAILPAAEAVVNPNQRGDTYPNKNLTGVGVAFKLAQQLLAESELSDREREAAEKWLLDLVAIGTVADMAELTGENRTLVKFGLVVLGKQRRQGLKQLIRVAALKQLDSGAIGFALAPRLNAAGRLTDAELALNLLTAEDESEAAKLAGQLNELNLERQVRTMEAVDQARAKLGRLTDDDRVIVLDGDWLSGIVGLVAGRLSQEFARPALIIERGESVSRGSARSIPALNMVEALGAQKEHLTTYGGHAGAAGFSLPTDKLAGFRKALQDWCRDRLTVDDLRKPVAIDTDLTPDELSFDLVERLEAFTPFGIGNRQPVFALKNVTVENIRLIGQDERHLKLTVGLPNGDRLTALGFGLAERLEELKRPDRLDLTGSPVTNEFNHTKTLEWHVGDFRPAS